MLPFRITALLHLGRRGEAQSAAMEIQSLLTESSDDFDRAIALDAVARTATPDGSKGAREIDPRLGEEVHAAFQKAGMADDAAELALEIAWEALRCDLLPEAKQWIERAAPFPAGKVPRIDIRRALVRARQASSPLESYAMLSGRVNGPGSVGRRMEAGRWRA